MGSVAGLRCASPLTLWLGELKPSTTRTIVDLNMSGLAPVSLMYQNGSLTLHFSFYWATGNIVWDLILGDKSNGVPVGC